MLKNLRIAILFCLIYSTAINASVLATEKNANWITAPSLPPAQAAVLHFRHKINLHKLPTKFSVMVSADNRYRLFVNGNQVSSGPQRSDVMHWRYHRIDLAPFLKQGENQIAALVWNWGDQKPVAQMSLRTALMIQGESDEESSINTNSNWKVLVNPGYAFLAADSNKVGGYYVASPGEKVDGTQYPWGWDAVDFNDHNWVQAFALQAVELRAANPYGTAESWQLTPATIPELEESLIRYREIRRVTGAQVPAEFIQGTSPLTIQPNSHVKILLDQRYLTNAYPVLKLSKGKNSQIKLTYAESLRDAKGNKAQRNQIENKSISGVEDQIIVGDLVNQVYRTLWFRTYRYVELDIKTSDEALTINDVYGIFTAYPLELKADFTSNEKWIDDIWQMNWRTARLCALETYVDTPYYEQLQYIGDARIQALMTLYLSGDDRLVRQAIDHFNLSRTPEGLTASRYPSSMPQYIPSFSLIWILMIHD